MTTSATLPILEGDSDSALDGVLRRISRVVPVDFVVLAEMFVDAGVLRYGRLRGVGHMDACALWARFDGTPSLSPWHPSLVPAGERNAFRPGLEPTVEAARGAWEALHTPVGLRHVQRMLVYDEARFVGYLALHRCADVPAYTSAELAAIRGAADDAVRLLVAWARATACPPTGGASVVLGDDGRVVTACTAARRWLTRERADYLAAAARRRDAGPFLVDGALVRTVRLDGPELTGVLCMVTLAPPVYVSPGCLLTRVQREVAELAAVGATVGEIAAHLGRSQETVRSHLKAVYRVLEVGSRVELAEALARGGQQ